MIPFLVLVMIEMVEVAYYYNFLVYIIIPLFGYSAGYGKILLKTD